MKKSEINSSFVVDLIKIQHIEEVTDGADWFLFPLVKIIHLYMYLQNNMVDDQRNIITVELMK